MHIVTTPSLALRRAISFADGSHHARAGHPERMADRNRSAVDVQLLRIDPQPVAAVDHLHGEGFVQFPQIDFGDP